MFSIITRILYETLFCKKIILSAIFTEIELFEI